IHSKQGYTAKAISLLKKAIELDEEFAEPYSALASLYAQNGRNEDAERLHLQALQLDSENADFCNNFGAFLQRTGRSDEAVKQYLKAIEIQPNHTVALVNAARTLKTMKHTKKAETLYKRYVLQRQSDSRTHRHRDIVTDDRNNRESGGPKVHTKRLTSRVDIAIQL
ncbi:unnamed protein product, partial [Oppiella nova]